MCACVNGSISHCFVPSWLLPFQEKKDVFKKCIKKVSIQGTTSKSVTFEISRSVEDLRECLHSLLPDSGTISDTIGPAQSFFFQCTRDTMDTSGAASSERWELHTGSPETECLAGKGSEGHYCGYSQAFYFTYLLVFGVPESERAWLNFLAVTQDQAGSHVQVT